MYETSEVIVSPVDCKSPLTDDRRQDKISSKLENPPQIANTDVSPQIVPDYTSSDEQRVHRTSICVDDVATSLSCNDDDDDNDATLSSTEEPPVDQVQRVRSYVDRALGECERDARRIYKQLKSHGADGCDTGPAADSPAEVVSDHSAKNTTEQRHGSPFAGHHHSSSGEPKRVEETASLDENQPSTTTTSVAHDQQHVQRVVADGDDDPSRYSTVLVNGDLDTHSTRAEIEQQLEVAQSDMRRMNQELLEKDQQLAVMKTFQSDASREVEELTSQLFLEAHRMVDEAKEASAKKDTELLNLRKQVEDMKQELVSRRTRPDRSQQSSKNDTLCRPSSSTSQTATVNGGEAVSGDKDSPSTKSMLNIFRKNLRKKLSSSPSNAGTSGGMSSPSSHSDKQQNAYNQPNSTILVDPVVYQGFRNWLDKSSPTTASMFYNYIVDVDLKPSLRFPGIEDNDMIWDMIISDSVYIERLDKDVAEASKAGVKCALYPDLLGVDYRIRYSKDTQKGDQISQMARNQIQTVIDLYKFILSQDLKEYEFTDAYKRLTQRRRAVYLARIGHPF